MLVTGRIDPRAWARACCGVVRGWAVDTLAFGPVYLLLSVSLGGDGVGSGSWPQRRMIASGTGVVWSGQLG